MGTLLTAKKLTKGYNSKKVLRNLDLEIETGKIYGLLGPNGSGKTTFLKIAAGVLRYRTGEITIEGDKPSVVTKSKVAYLPDVNFFYKWMKVKDAVRFFDDMFEDFDLDKAKDLIQFMKLDEDDKVYSLSKGMLARLKLALVLSREAKLYLFDEPLSGIDPVSREKIIESIVDSCNENCSFIISTHMVSDVEQLLDEVIFLSDGKVILSGNSEEFRLEKGISINELYMEVFK